MTTYDSAPYPSNCYRYSAPESLSAIAILFGMVPPELRNSQILEIGCASGGNVIPLAARYPDSGFLGVDLSKNQIDRARKTATALGLENLDLEEISILDIDLKGRKFDYIIAHGFYSWVASDVQERLLEICGENLSHNGIAYISYNTLPGWNAVKTIRDMMRYHGKNFDDLDEKVFEARRMLNFVSENIKTASDPYKKTLENEIKILQELDDNYLLHDHLEAVNEPSYFYEFMDKAGKYGLTYLAEADLPSMYLGNQTDAVADILSQINDTVRQEQYVDFISNRRFRMTLLAKEGVSLNRTLSPESVAGLRLIANYGLEQPIQAETEKSIEALDLVGMARQDQKATMTGRIACVCYLQMVKAAPVPQTLDEIVELAFPILEDVPKDFIRTELNATVLKFIFSGILSITTAPPCFTKEIADKPEVFKTAQIIAQNEARLPNMRHETVGGLTDDQRFFMQYVNGENTKEQIVDALRAHVKSGKFTVSMDGTQIKPNTDELKEYLSKYVETQLALFGANALLTKKK